MIHHFVIATLPRLWNELVDDRSRFTGATQITESCKGDKAQDEFERNDLPFPDIDRKAQQRQRDTPAWFRSVG